MYKEREKEQTVQKKSQKVQRDLKGFPLDLEDRHVGCKVEGELIDRP